jgi:2'-5' RNA ligase
LPRGVQRDLERDATGLRFTRPEGLHLTLRFLGSATAEGLARLEPQLRAAAGRCPRGEARVSGLMIFPDRGAPRVLVLGLELEERFLALQRECEAAAVAAGFPPEPRAFRPHVTLGRWKDRARRPKLPEVAPGTCLLAALVLYRSEPGPGGSRYSALARFPLPG